MEVKVSGYQVLERRVAVSGTTGRIYLPKAWIHKQVKVILLEPVTEESVEDEQ
ncbi:MAG: DUF2080 family transposase-associated protein [Candidatus Bathyarchaeota archaeon]|nr:DUF2080 family transposase-associated protein [Candidatus Bathyarchaeum sp.]